MTITSRLFTTTVTIALLMMATCLTHAQEDAAENLQTRMVVKQGQNVFIRLNYSGGVKGWDAAFGYHGKIVTALNSGYITILGPDGNVLTPRKGKLLSSWVSMRMKDPFDIVINLADVYDMSTAGRYLIEWGCKNVRSQMIQVEVIKEISSNDGMSTPEQEDDTLPPPRVRTKFH